MFVYYSVPVKILSELGAILKVFKDFSEVVGRAGSGAEVSSKVFQLLESLGIEKLQVWSLLFQRIKREAFSFSEEIQPKCRALMASSA